MEKTDNNKAWKILRSEYLIQRPWLTARRDEVELPDGRIVPEYYVLEYPDWVNVIMRTFLVILSSAICVLNGFAQDNAFARGADVSWCTEKPTAWGPSPPTVVQQQPSMPLSATQAALRPFKTTTIVLRVGSTCRGVC